jgi:hypothetical protein
MNTSIARLSYLNAHKKLAAKNKTNTKDTKELKNSLLSRSNSDKIKSKDNDIAVILLERALKGFENA